MSQEFDILSDTKKTRSIDIKMVKFVFFYLGNDLFGISAESINQVQYADKIYPIPRVPKYIVGLTALRDEINTIVHLKNRLGLENFPTLNDENLIIYVSIQNKVIGLLVDKIMGLKSLPETDIKQNFGQDFANSVKQVFLQGLIAIEDDIAMIINLNAVSSKYETTELKQNENYEDSLLSYDNVELQELNSVKEIE